MWSVYPSQHQKLVEEISLSLSLFEDGFFFLENYAVIF